MDDENKVQAYLELYKAQMEHFNNTRDFEWRINLALWSAILVITGFLVGKVTIDSSSLWIFAAIFLWHFIWMIQIQKTEDTDEHVMRAYRQHIEELAAWKVPPPEKGEWFLRFRWLPSGGFWWVVYETLATGVLLVLAWWALTTVPVSRP
jgi:hypothetical protein